MAEVNDFAKQQLQGLVNSYIMHSVQPLRAIVGVLRSSDAFSATLSADAVDSIETTIDYMKKLNQEALDFEGITEDDIQEMLRDMGWDV